jgi:hypothetical protein
LFGSFRRHRRLWWQVDRQRCVGSITACSAAILNLSGVAAGIAPLQAQLHAEDHAIRMELRVMGPPQWQTPPAGGSGHNPRFPWCLFAGASVAFAPRGLDAFERSRASRLHILLQA